MHDRLLGLTAVVSGLMIAGLMFYENGDTEAALSFMAGAAAMYFFAATVDEVNG